MGTLVRLLMGPSTRKCVYATQKLDKYTRTHEYVIRRLRLQHQCQRRFHCSFQTETRNTAAVLAAPKKLLPSGMKINQNRLGIEPVVAINRSSGSDSRPVLEI